MKKPKIFLLVISMYACFSLVAQTTTNKILYTNFTYSISGLDVSFKNNTINATTYKWTFGDGFSSYETSPTHTYEKSGTYTIQLTANNETQTDTYSNTITVTEIEPIARFSYTTQHPITVVFNNTSTDATTYTWDFGDNTTSIENSPTHKYAGIGVYKVTLTATNNSGKQSTISQNITVEAPTKCYFAGVTYKKLSVNNKYIRFKLIDDDIFTTTWCTSEYRLISTANLPYQYTLTKPIYLNDMINDEYYIINVYYNNSKSGDGTKLEGFKFLTRKVWAQGGYPTELSWLTNNGNLISFQLIWK